MKYMTTTAIDGKQLEYLIFGAKTELFLAGYGSYEKQNTSAFFFFFSHDNWSESPSAF